MAVVLGSGGQEGDGTSSLMVYNIIYLRLMKREWL